MKEYSIIKQNIDFLLKEKGLKLVSVFLFGSRAKGEHDRLSDYDLLIIVKGELNNHRKRKIRKDIYTRLHSLFPLNSFDIIVKPEEEFKIEKEIVNTISNEAVLEGIKI